MANTYTLIASSTVGSGGAASIDFSSIPSTYTDLVLKLSTRTAAAVTLQAINISFNGSTSSFTSRTLEAEVPAVASFSNGANLVGYANGGSSTASTFNNLEIYIPNYAGSNNKSYSVDTVLEQNATYGVLTLSAGLRSNTAAITSISFALTANNFAEYSTAYLYGISNS